MSSVSSDKENMGAGDCGDEYYEDCNDASGTKLFHRLLDLNQIAHNEVYTVQRLGTLSPKPWNASESYCGKCIAVVRFRANRPISIVSYGFFGPATSKSHGKYHMEIELLTEDYYQIAKAEVVTPVIRGPETFHVKFNEPVPILPCTWYNAKFSLLGPPTGQSQKICSSKQIRCGDHDNVMFRFEEPDSNQLPEISFTLRC